MMRFALAGRGVEFWAERREVRAAVPRAEEDRKVRREGTPNAELPISNFE
jgi:hypothetical protein